MVCLDAYKSGELSSWIRELFDKGIDRLVAIKHLNHSLFISSPFGRWLSCIQAFQDRYIELKD